MKVSKKQIANGLFWLLLMSSSLPFIYQAITIIASGQYVLWSYDSASKVGGGLGSIIPYIKDIACILLFLIVPYSYSQRKHRIYIVFFLLLAWGTIILSLNSILKNYSFNEFFQYLISGTRGYLFFVVAMAFFDGYFTDRQSIRNLQTVSLRIHEFVLLIQFVVSVVFIVRSGAFMSFGSGGLRIPGAFANSGTLGCYTIGAAVFICVQYCTCKAVSRGLTIIQILGVTILSFASGMRSAQLIVLMFVAITFAHIVFDTAKIKKRYILFFTAGMVVLALPTVISFIVERTGRGSFGESAVGRLETVHYLLNQGILRLIVGNGLGMGTNAAVSFQTTDASIFDGTLNTTIGQFGIVGLAILIVGTIYIFRRLFKYSYPNQMISYGIAVSVMIIFFTGNFFEQFAMILWIVLSCYLNIYAMEEWRGA